MDTTTSSTASATLDTVAVELAVTPNPAVAAPSTDGVHEWTTSFTLSVHETAGYAGSVYSLSTELTEASSGIRILGDGEKDVQVRVSTPTNAFDANATIELEFDVSYTLPGGGHEAVVDIALRVLDVNGYGVDAAIRFEVS